MTQQLYYHGSAVPGITHLEVRSQLHSNPSKDVLFLTSSIPYALVYIWSDKKTGSKSKWVTCGIRNRLVFYEEQFTNQLKEFYQGVSGYLYVIKTPEALPAVPNRENMFYSEKIQQVYEVINIPDVYETLLDWESRGAIQIHRYIDQTKERQRELTERICKYICEKDLLHNFTEESCFIQRYFKEAWYLAEQSSHSFNSMVK